MAPLARDRASRPQDFRVLKEIGDHYLDFTPAGDDLVVSFDAEESQQDPNSLPWLYRPFRDQGLAVLGVKTKRADWYRGEAIRAFFQSADFQFLTGAYDRVIFTGSSMGGFAALTFCTPGSLVLAHHPQTGLDPERTPWDTRFAGSQLLDWSGSFAQAEEGASRAARVFVTYDPFHETDRRHADRLDSGNLVRLKAPFLGHPLPGFLRRMGLLAELVPLALSGELTAAWWRTAIRKRRDLPRYHLIMAEHLQAPDMAARLMARAWHLSGDDTRGQDRIRRLAAHRKLGELFDRYLREEEVSLVKGPPGPDAELFRSFMATRS